VNHLALPVDTLEEFDAAYQRLKDHRVAVTAIIERGYGKTFYFHCAHCCSGLSAAHGSADNGAFWSPDAHKINELVRRSPRRAYDVDFFEQFAREARAALAARAAVQAAERRRRAARPGSRRAAPAGSLCGRQSPAPEAVAADRPHQRPLRPLLHRLPSALYSGVSTTHRSGANPSPRK
jgi:hypothetical protein